MSEQKGGQFLPGNTVAAGIHADQNVVRSSPVTLATADFCTVAYLGRDFDVTLFATMSQINGLSTFTEGAVGPGEVDVETVFLETAKLRLSVPAVIHLAGNLFFNLRKVNREAFDTAMASLMADDDASEGGGE